MTPDALAPWLRERLGADHLELANTRRSPLNGMSNDTLLVDATWTTHGVTHSGGFVVRRAPDGPSVYHSYDLQAQCRTMVALQHTDVPVPVVVGSETDDAILGRPFYVMRMVDGVAPPDVPPFSMTGWVLEAPADRQRALYEASMAMLARVHRLDVTQLDLGHLPHGFDVQLAQAEAWFRWAAEDRSYPVLEATLAWLQAHRPAPNGRDTLDWGDARIGNMLYRNFSPVCVLDWEMAAVGPPEVDLGWWMFVNRHHTDGIGVARLPGFPDDHETIALWEDATGRRAEDVFYYDVFAGFRFGIVVLRDARRAIERGDKPADWSYDRDNTVTRMLAAMLDL